MWSSPSSPLPRVPGWRGLYFLAHMVSNGIQGLGLSDDLLKHYKKEVGEMALGILDGKPFDSPVHEGILLTCMLEILPYDDSDNAVGSWSVAPLTQHSKQRRWPWDWILLITPPIRCGLVELQPCMPSGGLLRRSSVEGGGCPIVGYCTSGRIGRRQQVSWKTWSPVRPPCSIF